MTDRTFKVGVLFIGLFIVFAITTLALQERRFEHWQQKIQKERLQIEIIENGDTVRAR